MDYKAKPSKHELISERYKMLLDGGERKQELNNPIIKS
jgi:hypothetical protein